MTTTLLVLDKRLHQAVGDWIEVAVTTAITTNNSVISTKLNEYDGGQNDAFNDWWSYITDKANAGVHRQVSDYDTSTGTLTLRGAVLASDGANLATIRLYRYNRNTGIRAISDAIRETHLVFYKPLEDRTLITGNILPNAHFEDWSQTTYPDYYRVSVVTALEETTIIRDGAKSAKVTRASSDGYMYISQAEYTRLLDLMDKSVTFKCWVRASTASQAYIEIYTKQADGTTQTKTSSAHSGNGEYELLEIENYKLNDDLTDIEFRFKVVTTAGAAYFDAARVTGRDLDEYLLPKDFQTGSILRVYIQTSGYSDDICDDLQPTYWESIFSNSILNDGSYKYLQLGALYTNNCQIRLIGTCPLEEFVIDATTGFYDDTDTIALDEPQVSLLIAYAKYKLFQVEQVPVSSEDIARYGSASAMAYAEYQRLLPSLRMSRPSSTMKLPAY